MHDPAEPNPEIDPKRVKHLQRQLIAVAFARFDFKLAKTLAQEIESGYVDDITLWTALTIIYARPFLASNDVGRVSAKRFEQFDDQRHTSAHKLLCHARNHTFAHTGVHAGHGVWILPPGAWGERGDATIGRIPYAREVLPDIQALCSVQAGRATTLISDLVDELYGYREWPEGAKFILDFPNSGR